MAISKLQKNCQMVLQTNNLILAEKEKALSPLQYNTIVRICMMLKNYMTTDRKEVFKIQQNKFNGEPIPEFSLSYSDISQTERKSRIHDEVFELSKIQFWFPAVAWIGTEYETRYAARGPIFSSVGVREANSDYIIVKFNPSIIPLLLYYGKGVGGTYLPLSNYLKDSTSNLKQFRALLWSWKNLNTPVTITIDEFKKRFNVGYDNKELKRCVLEPAKEYFTLENRVWFDYEFSSSDAARFASVNKTGKVANDILIFFIHTNENECKRIEDIGFTIFSMIRLLFTEDIQKSKELHDIIISDPGTAEHLAKKYKYYLKQYANKKIDLHNFACIMRLILSKDHNIDVDIKPDLKKDA